MNRIFKRVGAVRVFAVVTVLTMSCDGAANALTVDPATAGDQQQIEISEQPSPATFALIGDVVSDIVTDADDAAVVGIAANLLAEDVERVTGRKPQVLANPQNAPKRPVIIGTIGKSRFIDVLIQSGKLDVSKIRGQWESFIITVIDKPAEGVEQALVIAGSDRRGTAYGVFTLSEAIGVSPWYYWADVPTPIKEQLHISSKTVVQGPSPIKYRGIFINDEDWGLQPWAAKHLDTDIKDLGPKTYARVFELLLRLKANYIWPGMHPCTKAFNMYPDNKFVADNYAIVMGASHCEPMLRNNVTEWDKKANGDWNYDTNRDFIYNYWETRVKENGAFENLYTVGMRGIHDSDMPGGGSLTDKRERLERVINDQRRMLAEHVNPDPSQVSQIFCPYKEVLGIYNAGLELADDITIVWPDDNFGYIRNLSTPEERKRSGGSGVYYHMSYWGHPQDFLWISSTSPAKIAYEMHKAAAYGADRVWVFNVGDIKPIEMEMEFALRLAYNPDRWPADKAMGFIEEWAGRTFGGEYASEIAEIFGVYYRLTQQVKPEHIDRVTFSKKEQEQRLAVYAEISRKADAIYASMAPEYRDAFFELVLYTVKCADLMNQKQVYTVRGNADKAVSAYEGIMELTRIYNQEVAGGKWDGMMDAAPRNTKVFHKPDVKRVSPSNANETPLIELKVRDAKCSGAMKLTKDGLRASDPAIQREDTETTATFVVKSRKEQKADLYFLARCPDEKQDSWFVSFNGKKTVSNDHSTGSAFQWIKIMDVELNNGPNELVISQRESGTVVKRVVLMSPGYIMRTPVSEPAFVFAASDYSAIQNTPTSQWEKIPGLGIEASAMALLPYETPSIPEASIKTAPSVSYAFKSGTGPCTVEARFLPTHRINDGMKLRYAISVDGGPVEIRDINAGEWSGDWAGNVLNGYSSGETNHTLKHSRNHTVTLYLLDPGMVLSQVCVFAE